MNGATVVAIHTFNMPDDLLAFVGVWSSEAFDRVEIRELNNTIDNEFFGNFVTGIQAPVPEPSALTLLVVGALGSCCGAGPSVRAASDRGYPAQ